MKNKEFSRFCEFLKENETESNKLQSALIDAKSAHNEIENVILTFAKKLGYNFASEDIVFEDFEQCMSEALDLEELDKICGGRLGHYRLPKKPYDETIKDLY